MAAAFTGKGRMALITFTTAQRYLLRPTAGADPDCNARRV